jgi:hypothetical protein
MPMIRGFPQPMNWGLLPPMVTIPGKSGTPRMERMSAAAMRRPCTPATIQRTKARAVAIVSSSGDPPGMNRRTTVTNPAMIPKPTAHMPMPHVIQAQYGGVQSRGPSVLLIDPTGTQTAKVVVSKHARTHNERCPETTGRLAHDSSLLFSSTPRCGHPRRRNLTTSLSLDLWVR